LKEKDKLSYNVWATIHPRQVSRCDVGNKGVYNRPVDRLHRHTQSLPGGGQPQKPSAVFVDQVLS